MALSSRAVAWISADQMRKTDRVAIGLGLSLPQMMENAGIHLSEVAWSSLGLEPRARVAMLTGAATTGGSRSSAPPCQSWWARSDRVGSGTSELGDYPRAQLDIVKRRDVPVDFDPPRETDAIIEGLIG